MERIIIVLIVIVWFGFVLTVCLDNHLREHFGGGCKMRCAALFSGVRYGS